ncbi:hypothetical protein A1O1_07445 [Capronia coronata CBS 617.96]|uniref:DNA/RNA-binding domain-containing protein n=1 Tax=Capronia coronata CBS 617.96 TaxID=1182541 RepID=W9XUA3_9EURO|nr:uncharacterized protein A1O1_07445 [Capronia coronata CBS 617.96]EXJ83818.1 hypothetical protein A1O1_07445 [Capronia coronata CBS 617.96]
MHDFTAAVQAKVAMRLWEAHSKVNQRYRPFLAQFREEQAKKRPVERRKAEKLYLEFIKSSMRFYRGYIQRLASNFRDVPEVMEIARRFNLDTLSADKPLSVDSILKKQIVGSCYSTLIRLGDLSRYRETELQTKERNWGPAKGYYELASVLDPASGISSNQLAVIALADQDHLRAVYHLYRAICVDNPAPLAQGNLKLEFKKIKKRSAQGMSILSEDAVPEGSRELQESFLLFHARCFLDEYVGYEEQQNQIIHLLADELRERPYDTVVRKYCLINISAEDLAAKRVRGTSLSHQPHRWLTYADDVSAFRSFEVAQHMNIATFFMFLQLLLDELRPLVGDTGRTPHSSWDGSSRITPVTRRILPHLRLYSGWLLSTVQQLLANKSLKVQIAALWQTYAEALSLLNLTFPVIRELSELSYLLDEDQDTLAFSAFCDFVRRTRFQDSDNRSKSLYDEAAFGPRSMENEFLYRVKCLVKDGLYLCKKDVFGPLTIPLTFAGNRFIFYDERAEHGRPPEAPPRHTRVMSTGSVGRDAPRASRRTRGHMDRLPVGHTTKSDAEVTESITTTMEDMVNHIVQCEPNEPVGTAPSVGNGLSTATLRSPVAQAFLQRGERSMPPTAIPAGGLVPKFRHSSSTLPNETALTSIWPTPFTARPGEVLPTSASASRPSTANRAADLRTASQDLDGSAQFREMLWQKTEEITNRTSPLQSLGPSFASSPQGVTPVNPWTGISDRLRPEVSPLRANFGAGLSQGTVISTPRSEASPFGAIGDPRPHSG